MDGRDIGTLRDGRTLRMGCSSPLSGFGDPVAAVGHLAVFLDLGRFGTGRLSPLSAA